MNDYDLLCSQYKRSDTKPDKYYSTLPTILKLVGDLSDKVVLDLGCGSGFFTREMAKTAKKVFGIDNSEAQLEEAKKYPKKNIEYFCGDVFRRILPEADIVAAPYVFTYARNVDELRKGFEGVYRSLTFGGYFVIVMDDPHGIDLSKFGAKKELIKRVNEKDIRITLFDTCGHEICKLNSRFYTLETIKQLMQEIGFKNFQQHRPIVSDEGVERFGNDFWKDYVDCPELMYISAEKK